MSQRRLGRNILCTNVDFSGIGDTSARHGPAPDARPGVVSAPLTGWPMSLTLSFMDLQHIRCFVAVAEELHFGKAAERLHLTPSPVSRTVKELERQLQV